MKIKITSLILLGALFLLSNCGENKNMAEQTLTIHYHRYDQKYEDWKLWTWLDDVSKEALAVSQDEYGMVFKLQIADYPPSGNICFVPKFREWEKKDDPDRCWSRSMPNEIWILQGNPTVFKERPSTEPFVRKAFLESPKLILAVLTNPVEKAELAALETRVVFDSGDTIQPSMVTLYENGADSSAFIKIHTSKRIDPPMLPAKVELKGYKAGDLYMRGILDSAEYISDQPLGCFYSPQQTEFVLYSPGAKSVKLNIYAAPQGGEAVSQLLQKGERGVWQTIVKGNLLGKYYTYQVEGYDKSYAPQKEVIDPYARAVTSHDGRGIITEDKTEVTNSPVFPFEDAVIYEMHVRDFTIDPKSGIKNRGKFLGWTESGTRLAGSDYLTGIDHLTELGVNTVQLMPVQDFEFYPESGNYFWGYMPVNFNSPEGWFATKTTDDTRIREFKMLVDALHKKGIKVVMDVVYNHTAEGNPLIRYNFNGIIPNFYYRQHPDGSYWNGSGCGNEMRSENPMVRRYIVESLKYWVEEYKVDGFRFDLMGLHDMDTMREIVQTLRQVKPDIFIYGEPWTAGDTPIEATVKGRQRGEGFSVFNDHYRDAMKGPWYNIEPGYIQTGSGLDRIKTGIRGSIDDFANSPGEAINYLVCHDGRTLWDQLEITTRNMSQVTEQDRRKMHKLAGMLLLTSQGVPFMHGGQEIMRTKLGEHNSYNKPDSVNLVDWQLKAKNHDVFEYYKGLIQIRKEHPMFRLKTAEEVNQNLRFLKNLPANVAGWQLVRGKTNDTFKSMIIIINPNRKSETVSLPGGSWNVIADQNTAGQITRTNISGSIAIEPISGVILYQ